MKKKSDQQSIAPQNQSIGAGQNRAIMEDGLIQRGGINPKPSTPKPENLIPPSQQSNIADNQ